MKLIPAFCIFLLMLSVSCKKSNDQPITPPPVVKVDTSTLLKSILRYYYDASGTTITDSSIIVWKYDDQRRVVQQATTSGNHTDTLFYAYLNDRYTTDDYTYISGSLKGVVHTVYYQGVKNRTDSVIINSGSHTYFYYNQLGQDSLEILVDGTSGAPPAFTTNYYYTGQNLDSTIFLYYGKRSSVGYYTSGNMTEYDLYTLDANNVLELTNHITYTNIPVGGLHVIVGSSKLKLGSTVFRIYNGTKVIETNTYQLDAANRVTHWTVNDNQPDAQKYLLSYY
ncbi:MAG: hypothetical protein M3N30_13820 [Bacteroidota bacterium]|nr:hypothetical protein [Bacteroidota bacterium]